MVTRISHEPAFVLHSYAWSESSLIVEAFCRHQGRVALVAKGAKKPSSNFRPVLLPLQPLQLSYTGAASADADLHTLKGAEWQGGHVMPTGDALLAGLYLNELLLRLLARADPHPALFDAYAGTVAVLATAQGEALEPVLRSFELLLLREIGLLPSLDAQTLTLQPLQRDERYALVPEGGLRVAGEGERASLAGAQWLALQRALDEPTQSARFAAILRACGDLAGELKIQLRTLLQYHCGQPPLRTRQLLRDLQAL
ncbi:MAG: DNA repair protein RecO [Burkholderiaceae bacterium]|nr:DNA repair protein RecO [Burkholderiaceae bacterium]